MILGTLYGPNAQVDRMLGSAYCPVVHVQNLLMCSLYAISTPVCYRKWYNGEPSGTSNRYNGSKITWCEFSTSETWYAELHTLGCLYGALKRVRSKRSTCYDTSAPVTVQYGTNFCWWLLWPKREEKALHRITKLVAVAWIDYEESTHRIVPGTLRRSYDEWGSKRFLRSGKICVKGPLQPETARSVLQGQRNSFFAEYNLC